MVTLDLRFTREFKDVPAVQETADIIHSHYRRTSVFYPTQVYSRDVKLLPNEVGCVVIMGKTEAHPVVRVCLSNKLRRTQVSSKTDAARSGA